MEKELIEKHDELLASMPETGEHDEASCPICIFKSEDNLPDERGEMETFTVEQLDAAVEAATSPLREEIASLKTAATEGEIASQVESVRSELTERISELEAERDLADAKTAAAEAALAEMVAFLEAAAAEAEEAALVAERKDARTEAIKAQTAFTDEKIASRIDEWAALSDEDFEARLADWAELSTQAANEGASSEESGAQVQETAMRNERKQASAEKSYSEQLSSIKAQAAEAGLDITKL